MKTTRLKKILTWLLCMGLLCAWPFAGMAEQTTLSVDFRGLHANAEGEWLTEPLRGVFEVWSGDTKLGTVAANPEKGRDQTLMLQTVKDITIRPVMEQMPEGYLIQDAPIAVSVTEGKRNNPPVLVYANAGLFTVQGEVGAAFAVLDAEGNDVLDFELDETGNYILPEAMLAGDYVLHQTIAAAGRSLAMDQPFTLEAYKGDEETILHLTVDSTITPTPAATEIPTEAPKMAENTEEPSTEEHDSAENMEASTTEPEKADYILRGSVTCDGTGLAGVTVSLGNGRTAVTDANGTFELTKLAAGDYLATFTPASAVYEMDTPAQSVTLNAETPAAEVNVTARAVSLLTLSSNAAVAYECTLTQGSETVASQAADDQQELTFTGLAAGDYTVTLTLPENLLLTSLNGHETLQRVQAQWNVTLTAGQESRYELGFVQGGSLAGTVQNLPDGTVVAVSGEKEQLQTTVRQGSFAFAALLPDVYNVSVTLPDVGAVSGEGWNALATETQYQASTAVQVTAGAQMTLPTLTRLESASLSGCAFMDENLDGVLQSGEAAVSGMTVELLNADGQLYTTTVTDMSGLWRFDNVPAGDWRVRLQAPEGLALVGKLGAYDVDASGASAVIHLAGVSETELNAALTEPAALLVNVFIDGNSNGERGVYERRLAGVTLEAIRVTETGEAVAATALSDENGDASFTTLAPGTYKVRATLPDGYGFGKKGKELRATSSIMEQSSETVQESEMMPLVRGETTRMGVGVNTMAAVTGSVWLDENADGIWNNNEQGLAGVSVTLTGEKNGLTYTAVSGEDGAYVLDQVRAGSYKLSVTCPDGLMFTRYSATGREMRSILTAEGRRTASKSITLEPGDLLEKQHVGLMREATIEGMAFLDANYNGIYDAGEATLAGVEVEVSKLNGDKVADVETGEDGVFRATSLRSGEYKVRVILPTGGYTFTATVDRDTAGNWFKARSGRRENTVDGVTVQAGETVQMQVGAILPGTISGVCYLDDNFSGVKDKHEKAVSGLTVNLLDEQGTVIAAARTNNKGAYTFEDLTPGAYQLSMNAKAGYAFTRLGEQNVFVNQSAGAGATEAFFLALGETRDGMDAGMILPGVVQGTVFADANDNGVQDEGETGLAGTVVKLMSENGAEFEATLDETGAYKFDAVMPGHYYVRYELPEDTVFASVQNGGNAVTGEQGVGASEWFDFATAQQKDMPLVGGVTLGRVNGVTFEDHDGSGTRDDGDALLAGAVLTLTPSRKDLQELTCTTGPDGSFAFEGLHPDTYTLSVTFPEGKVLTRASGFTLPLVPGENAQQVKLNLAMGERYEGQELGAVTPASVRGVLWLDENNDGRMDAGERTPKDEIITVVDENTGRIFATLKTDENGAFAVEGLVPGSYTFRYSLNSVTLAAPQGDSTFAQANGVLQQAVTVREGDSVDGLKAGIVMYTSIGGKVWLDRGGVIEPVSQAHVLLTDDSGAQVQACDSKEDGTYLFTQLMPGTYYLAVTLPEGQLVVEPNDERLTSGGQISVMVQTNGQSGQSDRIDLRMAEDQRSMDIGSVLPGSLGDQAWLDLDGDGWHDSDEPGLPGVTVRLIRDGEVKHEAVTDAYGYYLLENVYPSPYTLEVVYPAEVKPAKQGQGVMTSILPETDAETVQVENVSVESDKANRDADLGFVLRQPGVYPAGVQDVPGQVWGE